MALQQYNSYPWLTPVRVAATSNQSGTYFNGPVNNGVGATFTYATGVLTIDSVDVVAGNRVLLSAQTAANENGIYVCTQTGAVGVAAVLQRAADQQCIEQLLLGQYVTVSAGSVNAGGAFVLIEPKPAQLGIDDLVWESQVAVGAVTFSGPASTANALAVFSDTAGNLKAQSTASTLGFGLTISTGNFAVSAGTITSSGAIQSLTGNVTAGSSTHAGTFISFPASAANGTFIFSALDAGGAFNTTLRNSAMGQASVISLPDPGAATANVVLDAGNATSVSMLNLKYGATPVAQVDPGSCTITAAAGAANHCTITIQLKDGSGTNMARVTPFKVYLATTNSGLVLQSAASTGYSVTSGGVVDPTGSTTITQGLAGFSSATGGCVVDLLDTGKGTGNLILMLPNGFKASGAITAGSYG